MRWSIFALLNGLFLILYICVGITIREVLMSFWDHSAAPTVLVLVLYSVIYLMVYLYIRFYIIESVMAGPMRPLPNGHLRQSIKDLTSRIYFPVTQIYIRKGRC